MAKASFKFIFDFAGKNEIMKQAVCGILPILGFYLSVSRKDDPNKIGFIGGKIDSNETPEQALIRETFEETGLYTEIDNSIAPFIDKDGDYLVHCYKLNLLDKEHGNISEEETGIIRIANKIQLIMSSPYKDYNRRAFEWFNL